MPQSITRKPACILCYVNWRSASRCRPLSKCGPHWSVMQYKPIQHVEALPKLFSSRWE